jgi:hypothetical protein
MPLSHRIQLACRGTDCGWRTGEAHYIASHPAATDAMSPVPLVLESVVLTTLLTAHCHHFAQSQTESK